MELVRGKVMAIAVLGVCIGCVASFWIGAIWAPWPDLAVQIAEATVNLQEMRMAD